MDIDELEELFCNDSYKIDVTKIIQEQEIDLPIRMINILRNENFSNEKEFYQYLRNLIEQYRSNFLIPNHYIAFYPQIKEYKASKNITCQLSGAPILKGETYYCYHPIIEDLNDKKMYTVTKSIKASLGYQDKFPSTLAEYEMWYYSLKNAYYCNNSEIDFYTLSVECGETILDLVELRKGTIEHSIKIIKKEINKLEKLKIIKTKNLNDITKIENKIKKLQLKICDIHNKKATL